MAKCPIDVVQDCQVQINDLNQEIENLKEQISDLEYDLECGIDESDTEEQLSECEINYEIARDTTEQYSKLLAITIDTLNNVVNDPHLSGYHQKAIQVLIKEINYIL